MKPSERYISKYPLEKLLPSLDEKFIKEQVKNCDYTIEADNICQADKIDNKVNIADATVFFQMGYQYAANEIERKLEPIES